MLPCATMRLVMAAVLVLLASPPLLAHKEDFIGETLVFMTLRRGEAEPELWFDRFRGGARAWHAAFEYGITDRWMSDARVTRSEGHIQSARVESRYRIGEEGAMPVDIALSGEMNTEREEDGTRRYGIEPRLIVSKDFGKLNLTLNVSKEIPVNGGRSDIMGATGVRYDATDLFRTGAEAQYDITERRGVAIPQIWLTLPREVTIKGGYGVGIHDRGKRFTRIAVEIGF